ncbi:MAG: Ig-like domain-containing protein, partial [Deltaproteobacteria bacterium]|nr:Ig-like domain-containing protein [Deltaproteobacteria bacterium]
MSKKKNPFRRMLMPVLIMAFFAMLSGCNTGGLTDATSPGTPGGIPVTTQMAAAVGLGTDAVTVKSDDSNKANVTATALDASSAVIEGIAVAFSASCDPLSTSCGTLSASSVKTNADGKAAITFRSGMLDQSNRVITITATASGKSAQIPIQVAGSTLTMTSSTNVNIPSDGSVTSTLTVTAKNAGGTPVYNVPVT